MDIKQLAQISELLDPTTKESSQQKQFPFKIGEPYFIRTVTYHCTGQLVRIEGDFLVLDKAAFIADSKRFFGFLTNWKDNSPEIEPFTSELFVNTGAIVDACRWTQALPEIQQ